MSRTGQKKVAKKYKSKDETQYCIDGVLINEVLDNLSDKVEIIGAKVYVGLGYKKKKLAISNKLKRLGVQSIYANEPNKQAIVVFDATTKATIKRKCREVAREIIADVDKAYFKYLTVRGADGSGKFERTTKDIRPDDTDLRRKMIVLGLTEAEGKVNSLLAVLHAEAYKCKIDTVEVRTFICTKA